VSLPQLDGPTFITDGGMETVLIFHEGLELPDFASFVLLDDEAGSEALRTYFRRFLAIGREHGVGVLLDTPTWRASPDWGEGLGFTAWTGSPTPTAAASRRWKACGPRLAAIRRRDQCRIGAAR
jgi:hypothetical protein